MKKETLYEGFDKVLKHTKEDHIDNVITAIMSSNPVTSVFGSFVDNYLPKGRQQRLEDFIRDFAVGYENFKDKMQIELAKIKTDSFSFIFVNVIQSALIYYQPEKIEAFRAILLNSLTPESPSDELKEYYLNLLNSLTPVHIKILKAVKIPQKFHYEAGYPDDGTYIKILEPMFEFKLKPYPNDLIKSAWRELLSKGLVKEEKIEASASTVKAINIKGMLTEFGQGFIDFIVLEK
jgi:hypothetical protein